MNKQTLEQAALKWFLTANKHDIIFDLGWIKIFEAGAKWQQEQFKNESTANYIDRHIVEALVETVNQERMYSEEEVYDLFAQWITYQQGFPRIDEDEIPNSFRSFNEWFEQFKKK